MKPQSRFKKLTHLLLLIWPLVVLVNCAYEYRETDSGLTPDQIQNRLQQVLAASIASNEAGLRMQMTQSLLTQGNASVYYSRASNMGGPQGRVIDVFPSAFEVLSGGISIHSLKELEIFLVYRNDGASIDTSLIFAATDVQGQTLVITYVGGPNSNGANGVIQNNEFQAILQGGPEGRTVTLSSFDVNSSTSDLNDVIQAELFLGATVDDSALVGKITSLDGRN